MKKFLLFAVLLAGASFVKAGEPVFPIIGSPNSTYNFSQSTISFSSSTVTTIAAVTGYRKVDLLNGTSFFYKVDGSTQGLATWGFPVAANTITSIESNKVIYILAPIGVATSTGFYIQKTR